MSKLVGLPGTMTWLNPDHVVRVDFRVDNCTGAAILDIEMVNPDLSYSYECDHKTAHAILHALGLPVQWSVPK